MPIDVVVVVLAGERVYLMPLYLFRSLCSHFSAPESRHPPAARTGTSELATRGAIRELVFIS